MWLKIKFEDPLTINVNVNITQKQDDMVSQLEKQMDEWLVKLKQEFDKLKTISDKVS